MIYKTNDPNVLWEDTGMIKIHNYPASSSTTFSYITRVYKEIRRDKLGHRLVDGEPIYFYELPREQLALAIIMGQAENALSALCRVESFLEPATNI